MKPRRTTLALGALLGLTLLAALFAPQAKPDAVVQPAERARAVAMRADIAPAPAAAPSARVLSIRPRRSDEPLTAAGFEAHQWATPTAPPKAAPALPAPAPSLAPPVPAAAPALPFRVLGRYAEQDRSAVFLQHNDQNLVVRVGDTIAGDYRVERLEGSTLTLRYLPLDQAQTLDVGAPP